MASWIASGTAYSTHKVNTIPFYIYYSMFGFQRIGDLAWAAADARCRGFLMGATAGRTTLNGEGLQHEDGHSHLIAMTIPTCRTYDPAYAYELAVIIEEGINAMYVRGEECFYYLTVYNESYEMPAMPGEQVREGIVRGLYPVKSVPPDGAKLEVQLLGSGVILNEALRQQIWPRSSGSRARSTAPRATRCSAATRSSASATTACTRTRRRGALRFAGARQHEGADRRDQRLHAGAARVAFAVPRRATARARDRRLRRSETRKALRRFFEVDAENVAVAALYALSSKGNSTPAR